jgi:hypothetical protein
MLEQLDDDVILIIKTQKELITLRQLMIVNFISTNFKTQIGKHDTAISDDGYFNSGKGVIVIKIINNIRFRLIRFWIYYVKKLSQNGRTLYVELNLRYP